MLNSTDKLGKLKSIFLAHLQRPVGMVDPVRSLKEYCASNPRSREEPERKFTNIWLPFESTSFRAEPLQNRPSEE